jgi:hypothetical protein
MKSHPDPDVTDKPPAPAASAKHAREITVDDYLRDDLQDVVTGEESFGVRMIDTVAGRSQASLLINKMYAWRGYAGTHKLTDDPNRITLTATEKGEVKGTLTVGLDSPVGILADELFKDEVDAYRAKGARICEITKLAFDLDGNSKQSMAALFHLSVLHARDLHQCTHIFIEVNPRHRRFYESMLGFKKLGEPKLNTRVNAPAYLLCVDLDYVTNQIALYGGKGTDANVRSFYPLFYSPREEQGILNRLRSMR